MPVNQVDEDRLLRRRLHLQRYITSVFNDIKEANSAADKELLLLLTTFIADASERELRAVSQLRTGNKATVEFIRRVREIVYGQRDTAAMIVETEIAQLVEREAVVVTEALGQTEPPSMRGVASLPIAGATIGGAITASYDGFHRRLMAEITQNMVTDPGLLMAIIRGTKQANYKDGVYRWRDDLRIRPNVDQIINSAASNAATKVYEHFKIDQVDFVATLDMRTCARCAAAEAGSPYKLGREPKPALHPRCRCVILPRLADDPNERPYVKDSRSVKDIPQDERANKIGHTRGGIDEFIARLTTAQLSDMFGPTRAMLWREGKIDSVKDLVDGLTLRPLRLDELPEI